ncbi:DUF1523 family protein [Loktanella salsilacus]|uniref:DUF1523 family protein n=1 Tax=Loktanella salsilacus TaxID=195913 RepID=UPI0030021B62
MRILAFLLRLMPILAVGVVLHYVLPQHDIVRIVNTYQERQDLNDWTRIFWSDPSPQSATLVNRDVQFIQAVRKETFLLGFIPRDTTEVMVYRNEDTGWGWPFYFKFDTASLQTEADDLRSTPENPKWAVVTHYGWRNGYLSAFPNAIAIRPVSSPDETIIPWFNIAFFVIVIFLIGMVRAMWFQFRERMIDPAIDAAGDRLDIAQANMDARRSKMRRWFDSWKPKDRR